MIPKFQSSRSAGIALDIANALHGQGLPIIRGDRGATPKEIEDTLAVMKDRRITQSVMRDNAFNLEETVSLPVIQEIREAADALKGLEDILVIAPDEVGIKMAHDALVDTYRNDRTNGENSPRIHFVTEGNLRQLQNKIDFTKAGMIVMGNMTSEGQKKTAMAMCYEELVAKFNDADKLEHMVIMLQSSNRYLVDESQKHNCRIVTLPRGLADAESFFPAALLPLTLAGIDIQQLIEGAKDARDSLMGPDDHPIEIKAALMQVLAGKGRNTFIEAIYSQKWENFVKWMRLQICSAMNNTTGEMLIDCAVLPRAHHTDEQNWAEGDHGFVVFRRGFGTGPDIVIENCPDPKLDGLWMSKFNATNAQAYGKALATNSRPTTLSMAESPDAMQVGREVVYTLALGRILSRCYEPKVASPLRSKEIKKDQIAQTTSFSQGGLSLEIEGAIGSGTQRISDPLRFNQMLGDLLCVGVQLAVEAPPKTTKHGWITSPQETLAMLPDIEQMEAERRGSGPHFITGIGGSGNAFTAIHKVLTQIAANPGNEGKVIILDQPDAAALSDALEFVGEGMGEADLITASSSGQTRCTNALTGVLFKNGVQHKHTVVACAPRRTSPLSGLLRKNPDIAHLELSEKVDSRFSCLTAWMAMMMKRAGHNAEALFKGAAAMQTDMAAVSAKVREKVQDPNKPDKQIERSKLIMAALTEIDELLLESRRSSDDAARLRDQLLAAYKKLFEENKDVLDLVLQNVGLVWGAMNKHLGETAPTNVMVLMDPRLDGLVDHFKQMENESRGKPGVDTYTTVIGYEEAKRTMPLLLANPSYFTFVSVKDTGDKEIDELHRREMEDLEKAVAANGHASMRMQMDRADETILGQLLYSTLQMPASAMMCLGLRSRKQPSYSGQQGVVAGKLEHALLINAELGRQAKAIFPISGTISSLISAAADTINLSTRTFGYPAQRMANVRQAMVDSIKLTADADNIGRVYFSNSISPEFQNPNGRYQLVINPLQGNNLVERDNNMMVSTVSVFDGDVVPGNLVNTFVMYHSLNDGLVCVALQPGDDMLKVMDFIRMHDGTIAQRRRGDIDEPVLERKTTGSQFAVLGAISDYPPAVQPIIMAMLERKDVKMRERYIPIATDYEMAINGGSSISTASALDILSLYHIVENSAGAICVISDDGTKKSGADFVKELSSDDLFNSSAKYVVVCGAKEPVERMTEKLAPSGDIKAKPVTKNVRVSSDEFAFHHTIEVNRRNQSLCDYLTAMKGAGMPGDIRRILGVVPTMAAVFRLLFPWASLEAPHGVANFAGDTQEYVDWLTEQLFTAIAYNPRGETAVHESIMKALHDPAHPIGPLAKALLSFHGGEEQDRIFVGNMIEALKLNGMLVGGLDSLDGTSTFAALQSLGTFLSLYRVPLDAGNIAQIKDKRDRLPHNPEFLPEILRGKTGRDMLEAVAMVNHGYTEQLFVASKWGDGVEQFMLDRHGVFRKMGHITRVQESSNARPIIALGGAPSQWRPTAIWEFTKFLLEKEGAELAWTGAGTVDTHRILTTPFSVYGYTADESRARGRLRPWYELIMMAYLAEKVGGSAISGVHHMLDVPLDPAEKKGAGFFHQTAPFVAGHPLLVECYRRCHEQGVNLEDVKKYWNSKRHGN
ncbi:MAG: hypothetical protein WC527_05750 [Candidatus Margulisiibacteriota bacterium]